MLFQSTLPLRGATRVHVRDAVLDLDVISIHTPLAGSDPNTSPIWSNDWRFQSTLPLRGATAYRFSIDETLIISIHTPLAGSDVCGRISVDGEFISIHTPLAGSDVAAQFGGRSPRHFNPHSPCGERLLPCVALGIRTYFNPHSPCGERLLPCVADGIRTYFNPHSPCGERLLDDMTTVWLSNFNPHSPCGERPIKSGEWLLPMDISIHTPLAGSDCYRTSLV